MKYVVAYDITHPRRLRRVARICEDFGDRVQYSVFECNLDHFELSELLRQLASEMDLKEDKARVYPIHKDAEKDVISLGCCDIIIDKDFYII